MKKGNQIMEFYKTKDQELASLLYASGQILDSSEWDNGVCYFIFEAKNECERIVGDYYRGLIKLNAKAIFEALKTIKSIIYSR